MSFFTKANDIFWKFHSNVIFPASCGFLGGCIGFKVYERYKKPFSVSSLFFNDIVIDFSECNTPIKDKYLDILKNNTVVLEKLDNNVYRLVKYDTRNSYHTRYIHYKLKNGFGLDGILKPTVRKWC